MFEVALIDNETIVDDSGIVRLPLCLEVFEPYLSFKVCNSPSDKWLKVERLEPLREVKGPLTIFTLLHY